MIQHSLTCRVFAAGLLLAGFVAPASAQVTEDQVIDQALRIDAVSGADDLVAELTSLAQRYVDDPSDYYGIGLDATKANPVLAAFAGAQCAGSCSPADPPFSVRRDSARAANDE